MKLAENQNLYLACDHGGLTLKDEVIKACAPIEVTDLGTYTEDSVDYPDFALEMVKKIQGTENRGILICGTGIGMSIAANRFKAIRASLCTSVYDAKYTRLHNNSNILCLGARSPFVDPVLDIIKAWIETEYEGGRHAKRVSLFEQYGSTL